MRQRDERPRGPDPTLSQALGTPAILALQHAAGGPARYHRGEKGSMVQQSGPPDGNASPQGHEVGGNAIRRGQAARRR
jgi:hypothetical protein